MNSQSATTTSRGQCCVQWLGQMEYREAWRLQDRVARQRFAGEVPDTLLLLEHPPTLTLGRGADPAHVIAEADRLGRLGIDVVETNRGGDVTYHGPGQLVGYPIFDLSKPPHQQDLHRYLRQLEAAIIAALGSCGIDAHRFPGYTGVWTHRNAEPPAKIAAIGIRTSRWITQHGFALNVCTDLSHFDLIVPCGIHDFGVTSMQRVLGKEIAVTEPIPAIVGGFEQAFQMACQSV